MHILIGILSTVEDVVERRAHTTVLATPTQTDVVVGDKSLLKEVAEVVLTL